MTQAMPPAPVVVDDDRLLVDRPRQARERIAHERQQEAAQRQRPWRGIHRRRIEGLELRPWGKHGRHLALPRVARSCH